MTRAESSFLFVVTLEGNRTEALLTDLGGGNSNIFYFHPYLGKIPILTIQMG